MIHTEVGPCFLGRALFISTEKLEVGVTLDVGPRIILLRKPGGENILFEDREDNVNKDVAAIYGKGAMWHIYGGHRIWLSPEEEKTYYPDNEPVAYEVVGNEVSFRPAVWKVHDVQIELILRFTAPDAFDVEMRATNCGKGDKDLCLWGLTVMKCGGTLRVDLSREDTGYLANRNLVLWHYTDVRDERLTLENDAVIVKSNPKATKAFKLGIYNKQINAEYRYGDATFVKRYAAEEGQYPDYCCNFETYTSDLIHEVESLSPIRSVQPGETLCHLEHWSLQ